MPDPLHLLDLDRFGRAARERVTALLPGAQTFDDLLVRCDPRDRRALVRAISDLEDVEVDDDDFGDGLHGELDPVV